MNPLTSRIDLSRPLRYFGDDPKIPLKNYIPYVKNLNYRVFQYVASLILKAIGIDRKEIADFKLDVFGGVRQVAIYPSVIRHLNLSFADRSHK